MANLKEVQREKDKNTNADDYMMLRDKKITPNTIGLPDDVRVTFSEEDHRDDGQEDVSTAGNITEP